MLKLIAKVSHFAADWVAAEVVDVAVALAVVKQIEMNGIWVPGCSRLVYYFSNSVFFFFLSFLRFILEVHIEEG